MTTRELGLFAAPTVEVELESGIEISTDPQSLGWTKYLPSNSLIPLPPYGYFFDMTVVDDKKYYFYAAVKEKEFGELIELLMQLSTQSNSIEPIKPSGLGWPEIHPAANTKTLCSLR
jgi:hypothetical protein